MIVAIVAAAVLFASPITADYRPGPRDTRDQRICGGADNATPAQQIAACTAILAKERDPRNRATAHDYRARGHAKLKRFDAALADANEAIGLQPNDADFLTNRGVLHAEMGEFDLAIRDYSDAIRMNPNDHIAYFNRAKDRRRKNEIDAALDDLSMALKINPKYASALYMRASLFEDLGRFDVALKDVDEVLLLTPRDDRALNLRGLVMEGKGQLDQAVKNYNQAIAIDPAYEGYFFNRGRAHRLMGRYDLSIKDFDRGLEINPARSKYGRGVTFFASGDLRVPREQALRFDVDQGRRHIGELGTQVDIEFSGPVHVVEVLAGDLGHRQVRDVDIVGADQGEQQIERAFEAGQGNGRRGDHLLSLVDPAECREVVGRSGGEFGDTRQQVFGPVVGDLETPGRDEFNGIGQVTRPLAVHRGGGPGVNLLRGGVAGDFVQGRQDAFFPGPGLRGSARGAHLLEVADQ
jgi:tetratricopeptide (TPR) repeat protein